jgi:Gas vesicle synthesis protein GvpL/GvpF
VSLLLYAITDAAPPPEPAISGVDGAPVRLVAAAGLWAAVSDHDGAPELDEETLWTFERVVESLMNDCAVLPVRFGTLLAGVAEVEEMLTARRDDLAAKLDRVRGAVELSVRGVWPDPNPSAASRTDSAANASGTSYMRSRLEPHRRAGELAARVHAHLDDHARASSHRLLTRATVPLSAAFLVERGREGDFLSRVRGLDAELSDADLVCTGPWPAYSFVGDTAGD